MQETLGWLEATIEIESLFEGAGYLCLLSWTCVEELAWSTRQSHGTREKCLRGRGSERTNAHDLVLGGYSHKSRRVQSMIQSSSSWERAGPSNLQTLQRTVGKIALQKVKAEDTSNLKALLGDKNFDKLRQMLAPPPPSTLTLRSAGRKMEVASKPRKEARRRTPRVATTMKTLSHWLMAPSRCF